MKPPHFLFGSEELWERSCVHVAVLRVGDYDPWELRMMVLTRRQHLTGSVMPSESLSDLSQEMPCTDKALFCLHMRSVAMQ